MKDPARNLRLDPDRTAPHFQRWSRGRPEGVFGDGSLAARLGRQTGDGQLDSGENCHLALLGLLPVGALQVALLARELGCQPADLLPPPPLKPPCGLRELPRDAA